MKAIFKEELDKLEKQLESFDKGTDEYNRVKIEIDKIYAMAGETKAKVIGSVCTSCEG